MIRIDIDISKKFIQHKNENMILSYNSCSNEMKSENWMLNHIYLNETLRMLFCKLFNFEMHWFVANEFWKCQSMIDIWITIMKFKLLAQKFNWSYEIILELINFDKSLEIDKHFMSL